MAFFDKLSETIANTGKDVAQKAKELAEISRLNGQISSQENEINRTYQEMGKEFYEQHREATTAMMGEKYDAIDAAKAEIERLKKEVMIVKGVQECPNCKADVPKGVAFCSACGCKMPEIVETTDDVVNANEVNAKEVEAEVVEPQAETSTDTNLTE